MIGGLAILILSFFLGVAFGAFRRVANQKSVQGEIVRLDYTYDSDEKRPTYRAVVEYIVNGQQYHVASSFRSSSFRTGKKKTVYYNQNRPENAFIRPGLCVYIAVAAFGIAGIVLIIKDFLL